MGETADKTLGEIVRLRAEMSKRVADLRHDAEDSARSAAPLAVAAAGVGMLVLGVVIVVKHRHKAEARRLVGTLKQLAETLEKHPATSIAALGALPAHALQEVIERKPSEPPLGTKLLEVAVRSAVTTAVGFGLKALRDRLVGTGDGAPEGATRPAPGSRTRR
jgi:hypothetical protein